MKFSDYLQDLQAEPPPLTSSQRRWLAVASVVAAVSRIPAISKSIWDWDEALFCLGMREYNVVQHRPHPPGYPLYIAFARLFRPLLGGSDFRALQAVTLIGAMLLFPALFLLARELRMTFRTSLFGSLLYVFLPNVWYYGGTATTDVPATALVAFAAALLLRGCRSRPAYFKGALVLGISAAFRPQNLLIGLAPALLSSWVRLRERWRDVIGAAAIGAAVIVASYGGAALASESVQGYIAAVRLQQHYVMQVDSYHNPGRAPLRDLAWTFFKTPMSGGHAAGILMRIAALGLIAAVALRRWPQLIFFAMFAPFAIFAWLMLDMYAVTRYSVGYVMLHAMFAALFVSIVGELLTRIRPAAGIAVETVAMLGLTIGFIVWTLPALREVRRNPSPPMQVMRWIMKNVPKNGQAKVVLTSGFGPFGAYFLDGWNNVTFVESENEIPPGPHGPDDLLFVDGETNRTDARRFVRKQGRIWKIARQRYFSEYAVPVVDNIVYGEGWHQAEQAGGSMWRWMAGRSTAELAAVPRRARLQLTFYVPVDTLPKPPHVTISLNGRTIDSFTAETAEVSRRLEVDARADANNVLTIETSEVANPAKEGRGGDARDLGLRLDAIGWMPISDLR